MQANRCRYAVTEIAGLLGASRGAYYKWARDGVSQRRGAAGAELLRLIREIAARHHRRYGSPRVRQELRRAYGKRVARLMREHGLNARRRRKFIPTTGSQHGLAVCENLLDRQFRAERGGQKRVPDITCLRTCGGWVYLAVALDLFDRKVVGWALGAGLQASDTTVARPGNGSQEPRPGSRAGIPLRPWGAVVRPFFSRGSGQAMPGSSPEHEPQRQLGGDLKSMMKVKRNHN
jgi:transposase InsO family protein